MRRVLVCSLFCLAALPGLAAAQTAGGPPGTVQPAPVTAGPGATQPGIPPPGGHDGKHGARLANWRQQFAAANISHDGHLTLAQARAGQMRPVARHFAAIDTSHRGYVTFNDVLAWRMDRKAQKLQQRATALRAEDK